MQPTAGDADAPLIAHLTRVATTAAAALQAIHANDDAAARRAVDRLRVQWSTLRTGDTRQLGTRFNRARSVAGAEAIHQGLMLLATCEEVVTLWAKAGFERALSTGEPIGVAGWHAVLDHLLPLRWNFECDVLLVHGRLPPELAQAITERGQRRILLNGPDEGAALPPGCVRLQDEQAIIDHFTSFKRMLPKRHVSIDVADGLLDPAAVQQMDAFVGTALQNQRMNWTTWNQHAPMWREQSLGNLAQVVAAPDLGDLGRRFAGRPAIVVSPGPSLSKNIDALRLAQGRAVLLAPLQTLKRLYREGIRPDFAMVLDAHDHVSAPRDFVGDIPGEWLPDLIATNAAHPNVLRRFAQSRVYFFDASTPLDVMLVQALSAPWPALGSGSVSISCLRLARHWRCSPIILVGQDLAFADGQRYAAGAGRDAAAPEVLRELPGYYGGTVQTAPDYFLFHHQFEALAAGYRAEDPSLRLFNCTEGGASIGGFEQQPLRDVLQAHVLHLPAPDAPPSAPDRVPTRRREIRARLQQIQAAARQGLQLADACDRSAAQAHRGAAQLNRLSQDDGRLRTHLDRLLYLVEERTRDVDDALTAWEASEELEDYLRGSARFRSIAREVFGRIEAMLGDALHSLDSPARAGEPSVALAA